MPLAVDIAHAFDASPTLISSAERLLAVEVIGNAAGLAALGPEWLALEERTGRNTIFQSFPKIQIWARHFLPEGQRLHVAVVRRGGRAALILPLVISGRTPFRIARMAAIRSRNIPTFSSIPRSRRARRSKPLSTRSGDLWTRYCSGACARIPPCSHSPTSIFGRR